MTAYLAKAIQDCGAHQFEGEMCYTVPKVAGAGDEGTIGAGNPLQWGWRFRAEAIDLIGTLLRQEARTTSVSGFFSHMSLAIGGNPFTRVNSDQSGAGPVA